MKKLNKKKISHYEKEECKLQQKINALKEEISKTKEDLFKIKDKKYKLELEVK